MQTRPKTNQNINKINEVENPLSDMFSGGGVTPKNLLIRDITEKNFIKIRRSEGEIIIYPPKNLYNSSPLQWGRTEIQVESKARNLEFQVGDNSHLLNGGAYGKH